MDVLAAVRSNSDATINMWPELLWAGQCKLPVLYNQRWKQNDKTAISPQPYFSLQTLGFA
jgi:hypothetical protein